MSDASTFEVKMLVTLTPEQLALAFCEFDFNQQATFFTAIGRHAAVWAAPGASMQWWRVGKFLRNHSTHEGRRVVLGIAEGISENEP